MIHYKLAFKVSSMIILLMLIIGVCGCGTTASKAVTASVAADSLPRPLPDPRPGMQRIHLRDIGSIDIPVSLMEEQNIAWRQAGDAYAKEAGLPIRTPADTVILQQKGLDRYCRIMIHQVKGKAGDFHKLTDKNYMSRSDLDEFTKEMHRVTRDGLRPISGRVLEMYPARLEDVNGMSALVASYRRQIENNPTVLVWEYRFMNNDRMVVMVMSYRENETSLWQPAFRSALESFRIQQVR